MPYPNEHASRMVDPDKFIEGSMRSKEIARGIRMIMGKLKSGGGMTVQAIRFDKEIFTAEQAKAWLKAHDYKPMSFEKATG